MAQISFQSQKPNFQLHHPRKISAWLKLVAKREKMVVKSLSYIFCDDSFLLSLNKSFLNHSTLTDVITFDLSTVKNELMGEIYISIDRVYENALTFNVTPENELSRVMVHGVLHLVGYNDKTKAEIKVMRIKEEAYLSLR